MIRLSAICLFAHLFCATANGDQFLRQSSKISFDEDTYVVFEDVGRVVHGDGRSTETSVSFGKYVRLQYFDGGKKSVIDLIDPQYDAEDVRYPSIKPAIKEIRFKNENQVWLIGRQGKRGDRAILYDLASKRVLLDFGGFDFSLSPQASRIAFFHQYDKDRRIAVFVNDALIYPRIEPRYDWVPGENPIKGGMELAGLASESNLHYSKPESKITWKTEQELEFDILEGARTDNLENLRRYSISNLPAADKMDSLESVRINPLPLGKQVRP